MVKQLAIAVLAALTLPALADTAPVAPANGNDDYGNPCQQWGRVARGILMAKQAGQTKRKGQSPMERQLLDMIYDHDTTGMTLESAYSAGYKACLPVLKRGLN
jgi:hypothetical protein